MPTFLLKIRCIRAGKTTQLTRVDSLWWKEKTDSCKLFSGINVCMPLHTPPKCNFFFFLKRYFKGLGCKVPALHVQGPRYYKRKQNKKKTKQTNKNKKPTKAIIARQGSVSL